MRAPQILGTALLLALTACKTVQTPRPFGERPGIPVRVDSFGRTPEGREAKIFTLRNGNGLQVDLTDHGATIVRVLAPDRTGETADITLGFDDVAGYASDANQYFGCTVGRVANRIAEGRFTLDGEDYTLAVNNGPNHLHGGDTPWGAKTWRTLVAEPGRVLFELESPDGDEGYPGRVVARTEYVLTEADVLRITMTAESDARTPVSMTNHAYWNLAGAGAPTILDHVVELAATEYTPMDATLIPDGTVAPVAGPLDFTEPKAFGADIDALTDTPSLGYDHNYLYSGRTTESDFATNHFVARVTHPGSGRSLEFYSDQPAFQFYSGNFLFGQEGKEGRTYPYRSAFAIEPQGVPNAVNDPAYPSVIVEPGTPYRHVLALRFGTDG